MEAAGEGVGKGVRGGDIVFFPDSTLQEVFGNTCWKYAMSAVKNLK